MPTAARWLPGSLFGRLMLVLAGGLMLAQLLSAAINVAERDRLLARSFGLQPAQRMADVVKLLDGLGPAERERVVAVFSVPPMVLSLHDGPTLTDAADRSAAANPRGALFVAQLQAALGEARATRVETRPGALPDPAAGAGWRHEGMPGMGAMAPMMHGRVGPGAALLRAEVQLRDGRWARFDTHLPPVPDALPWRLVATLAVLLGTMLALSWVAVRWVVRPLHVLEKAARSLGEDLASPPLPEDGPREVRQAARAFNTMQQRLARFVDERTRMLAALSHDLKTPLTRLRLRTELLDDDDARTRFTADLQEMETMVTQTLDFMRGLGGHEPRAAVDVEALLASLQSDHEAMGRVVTIEGHAEAPYLGVPSLLRRALGNLIDNAVLYGGSATVRIDDRPDHLLLHVLDPGPGIAAAELERVFEPFHRLEASRNRATGGTGLGLGIARSIARLHGGDVRLENRPQGGLDAVLSLPRQAQG